MNDLRIDPWILEESGDLFLAIAGWDETGINYTGRSWVRQNQREVSKEDFAGDD
jgi:hypothetical protein